MSSDPAISAEGLGKSYPLGLSRDRPTTVAELVVERIRHPFRRRHRELLWALRDVSFDVGRGEALGIIGRNGAGKSTALKILSRITEPTEGQVVLRGRVGSLLEVGTGFHQELTGRENVYLNGAVLGMSRREIAQRFDEIVEFSGIGQFLDTPVKRYSTGMGVRLAFAVAAHLEPEILVVDEVLAVGDAEFQRKCLGKMSEVTAVDARTVLFVSHNMAAIQALCSRCLVLERGRLVFDGPPEDAIAHYLALGEGTPGSTPGDFDLSGHAPVRAGDPVMLRRLRVRNAKDDTAEAIRMNDRFALDLDVHALDRHPLATVGFELRNDLDTLLMTGHTKMKPPRAPAEAGPRSRVRFEVEGLPMTPGNYWVDLGVYDPRADRVIDRVPRAGRFTITSADVLGNGYEPNPREGMLMVGFDWEMTPDPNPAAQEEPVQAQSR